MRTKFDIYIFLFILQKKYFVLNIAEKLLAGR
jgi:hypothetical protein